MRRRYRPPTVHVLRSWGHGTLAPLPLALQGHEEGVHDLRVAARRLRTALPILARKPGRPRIRRVIGLLRQIGDLAGVSRDCDVKLLMIASRPESPAAEVLTGRLRETRGRMNRILAEGLHALDLTAFQGAVGAVAVEDPESLFVVATRLGQKRDELRYDIAARLAGAARFDADALHRMRIRIRRLRYVGDIYAEIRGVSALAPGLKQLQDALGAVQDAWMLSRWLAHETRLARRRGDRELADLAAAETRHWRQTARAHHRAFLAGDPARSLQEAIAALGGTAPRVTRGPAAVIPRGVHLRNSKQSA